MTDGSTRALIEIGQVVIHADEHGRFSLNDLHRAAGGENKHRPSLWTENQQAKALAEEIGKAGIPALVIMKGGAAPGSYACKEMIYAYAMWISPAFHLKVIRTFDAVSTDGVTPKLGVMRDAVQLFQPFFEVAILIGCDKQAAAISANQAVQAVSGANVLQLMGRTHIESENQEALYFTPTEIGKQIGSSPQAVNRMLVDAGLQAKPGEHWEATDAGKKYSRIFDTGKKHGSGVPIQQVKWSADVIRLFAKDAA